MALFPRSQLAVSPLRCPPHSPFEPDREIYQEGRSEGSGKGATEGQRRVGAGGQASDGEVTGEPPVSLVSAVPAQRSYPG